MEENKGIDYEAQLLRYSLQSYDTIEGRIAFNLLANKDYFILKNEFLKRKDFFKRSILLEEKLQEMSIIHLYELVYSLKENELIKSDQEGLEYFLKQRGCELQIRLCHIKLIKSIMGVSPNFLIVLYKGSTLTEQYKKRIEENGDQKEEEQKLIEQLTDKKTGTTGVYHRCQRMKEIKNIKKQLEKANRYRITESYMMIPGTTTTVGQYKNRLLELEQLESDIKELEEKLKEKKKETRKKKPWPIKYAWYEYEVHIPIIDDGDEEPFSTCIICRTPRALSSINSHIQSIEHKEDIGIIHNIPTYKLVVRIDMLGKIRALTNMHTQTLICKQCNFKYKQASLLLGCISQNISSFHYTSNGMICQRAVIDAVYDKNLLDDELVSLEISESREQRLRIPEYTGEPTMVVIAAPPGSGKTEQLRQFILDSDARTLDSHPCTCGDPDVHNLGITRFFYATDKYNGYCPCKQFVKFPRFRIFTTRVALQSRIYGELKDLGVVVRKRIEVNEDEGNASIIRRENALQKRLICQFESIHHHIMGGGKKIDWKYNPVTCDYDGTVTERLKFEDIVTFQPTDMCMDIIILDEFVSLVRNNLTFVRNGLDEEKHLDNKKTYRTLLDLFSTFMYFCVTCKYLLILDADVLHDTASIRLLSEIQKLRNIYFQSPIKMKIRSYPFHGCRDKFVIVNEAEGIRRIFECIVYHRRFAIYFGSKKQMNLVFASLKHALFSYVETKYSNEQTIEMLQNMLTTFFDQDEIIMFKSETDEARMKVWEKTLDDIEENELDKATMIMYTSKISVGCSSVTPIHACFYFSIDSRLTGPDIIQGMHRFRCVETKERVVIDLDRGVLGSEGRVTNSSPLQLGSIYMTKLKQLVCKTFETDMCTMQEEHKTNITLLKDQCPEIDKRYNVETERIWDDVMMQYRMNTAHIKKYASSDLLHWLQYHNFTVVDERKYDLDACDAKLSFEQVLNKDQRMDHYCMLDFLVMYGELQRGTSLWEPGSDIFKRPEININEINEVQYTQHDKEYRRAKTKFYSMCRGLNVPFTKPVLFDDYTKEMTMLDLPSVMEYKEGQSEEDQATKLHAMFQYLYAVRVCERYVTEPIDPYSNEINQEFKTCEDVRTFWKSLGIEYKSEMELDKIPLDPLAKNALAMTMPATKTCLLLMHITNDERVKSTIPLPYQDTIGSNAFLFRQPRLVHSRLMSLKRQLTLLYMIQHYFDTDATYDQLLSRHVNELNSIYMYSHQQVTDKNCIRLFVKFPVWRSLLLFDETVIWPIEVKEGGDLFQQLDINFQEAQILANETNMNWTIEEEEDYKTNPLKRYKGLIKRWNKIFNHMGLHISYTKKDQNITISPSKTNLGYVLCEKNDEGILYVREAPKQTPTQKYKRPEYFEMLTFTDLYSLLLKHFRNKEQHEFTFCNNDEKENEDEKQLYINEERVRMKSILGKRRTQTRLSITTDKDMDIEEEEEEEEEERDEENYDEDLDEKQLSELEFIPYKRRRIDNVHLL